MERCFTMVCGKKVRHLSEDLRQTPPSGSCTRTARPETYHGRMETVAPGTTSGGHGYAPAGVLELPRERTVSPLVSRINRGSGPGTKANPVTTNSVTPISPRT